MMRLIGYLRVSTARQAKREGLPVQREAIEEWAAEDGHQIVGWQTDAGLSGTTDLEDRMGLEAALEAVSNGEADGIAVWKLDRLSRDMGLQEWLIRDIRKHRGGDVFSTMDSEADSLADDPKDPGRKLQRQIMGAIADYERAMIALRMAAGRDRKRQGGGYAGDGAPRYGLQSVDRQLEPDADEVAVIQDIMRMRREGLSLRQIAASLQADGVPTPYGRRNGKAPKWGPQTVANILERVQP
jgi:DNA invertase Pin-like site-specific DNA recombinase